MSELQRRNSLCYSECLEVCQQQRTIFKSEVTILGPLGYRGNLNKSTRRHTNPIGPDGKPLACKVCNSIFHFARNCPDSYENNTFSSELQENDIEPVLFTGDEAKELQVLVSETINSAILDSACSSTVAGSAWMNIYLDSLSDKDRTFVTRSPSNSTFRFGGGAVLQSKEKVNFPCELAGVRCFMTSDVVDSEIPLLLGKPSMKKAKVILDLENDRAEIFGKTIDLQLTSAGHYCIPLLPSNLSVEETAVYEASVCGDHKSNKEKKEIVLKIHKQFAHPSCDRLRLLLKDAGLTGEDFMKLVDEISSSCTICLKYRKSASRPVVCLPIAKEFNHTVAMDLKEWKPGVYFLHLIDLATRFSLSSVIRDKRTDTVIDKIMRMWIGGGFGTPVRFLSDNGGEFSSDKFRDMASNLNVEVWTTSANSPWQNGICERNHAVIDNNVSKMLNDNPRMDLEIALIWAVNAKNSLQMTYGCSPYQLVFGVNPKLPSVLSDSPPALEGTTKSEIFAKHISALHSAREAFIKAESAEKIRRALRHQIRPTGETFNIGEKVYYKKDSSSKWQGPSKVLGQDGKIIFLRHGSVYVRVPSCRILKVWCDNSGPDEPVFEETKKIASLPSTDLADFEEETVPVDLEDSGQLQQAESPSTDTGDQDVAKNITFPKINELIQYKIGGEETWNFGRVISRGGKATGKYRGWFNVRSEDELDDSDAKCIDFTNPTVEWKCADFHNTEENVNLVHEFGEEEIEKAKRKEIENWKRFNVFEEVEDNGQPRITTRWVITEKITDIGNKTIKARLVARGFEERSEHQTDSPTVGKETLKIFLALSSSMKWETNIIDIKAAFLQGNKIEREIYLKPADRFSSSGKLWKLNKCVYGLNDASRHWYFRVCDVLKQLGCQKSEKDPALFYQHEDGLCGALLIHVDDFIWAGSTRFRDCVINPFSGTFCIGKQDSKDFKYIGLHIQHKDEEILLDQNHYIQSAEIIHINNERKIKKQDALTEKEISQLRSISGQINWIVNQTRPDAAYSALELSTSVKEPKLEHLIMGNKILKQLKMDCLEVKFPMFKDINNLRLRLYCDAAFANLPDGFSSSSGMILFLVDQDEQCCPIMWKSNKIRRVVNSTLSAETLAMSYGLDCAFYLGSLLSELIFNITDNAIPIDVYTDNRSLVESLNSTKLPAEKRLRVEIAKIKQMHSRGEISKIQWVCSKQQIPDVLTKRGVLSEGIFNIFINGRF